MKGSRLKCGESDKHATQGLYGELTLASVGVCREGNSGRGHREDAAESDRGSTETTSPTDRQRTDRHTLLRAF